MYTIQYNTVQFRIENMTEKIIIQTSFSCSCFLMSSVTDCISVLWYSLLNSDRQFNTSLAYTPLFGMMSSQFIMVVAVHSLVVGENTIE